MSNSKSVCKVVVAGDGGVGKTTLTRKLMGKNGATSLTRGVEIESIPLKNEDGFIVNSVFWDLGGQPQFRCFQDSFFKGANIVLLVFDLNRYSSFHHIQSEWLPIVIENRNSHPTVEILIGNKIDLGQTIDDSVIRKFALENNLFYIKISAKESTNLDKFVDLLLKFINNFKGFEALHSLKLNKI